MKKLIFTYILIPITTFFYPTGLVESERKPLLVFNSSIYLEKSNIVLHEYVKHKNAHFGGF